VTITLHLASHAPRGKLMRRQLGITELVDAFERVGVLQITDSEDLDLSLAAVLQRTVPDVLVRTQVTIHLNGELAAM
jgi:hypothetical protein